MPLTKGDAQDLSNDKQGNDEFKKMQRQLEAMNIELINMKAEKANVAPTSYSGMSEKQLVELISAVSKASKERPDEDKLNMVGFVDEKNIDPDDYDEVGVMFCTYGMGYVIVDDVRQGYAVQTPYKNKIFFMFEGMTKTRDDRGREVLNNFSVYRSHSKKEQKWLREHKFFNSRFFETVAEAMKTNVDRAQKLVRFINIAMGMEQDSMVKNCRHYNVPLTNDTRGMRIALANKMLDAVEDPSKVVTSNIVKEKYEEELFLSDPSKKTVRK